jgi:hypothetical protein
MVGIMATLTRNPREKPANPIASESEAMAGDVLLSAPVDDSIDFSLQQGNRQGLILVADVTCYRSGAVVCRL